MSIILLQDAGSQLTQLIQEAQAGDGEEVVFTRDGIPVAKLVLLPETSTQPRRPGYGCGKDDILYMADDFDAPLEDFKDYM